MKAFLLALALCARAAAAPEAAPPAGPPLGIDVVSAPSPLELGALAAEAALPRLLETQAGRDVLGERRQSPVPIAVLAPVPGSAGVQPKQAAVYDLLRGAVEINLTATGLTPAQFAQAERDGSLRERVADALDATVLHELKHWKTRETLGDIALTENEVEAHHAEARYMLERLQKDPDYLRRLPPAIASRKIPLLQAWLAGPERLTAHVAGRYPKVPSVTQDDPADRVAELDRDLAGWRGRRDHYDEQRAELERRMKLSRALEGSSERVSATPHWKLLAVQLADFPTREAVDYFIAQLEDARAFWLDDARRERAKEHYLGVWARLHADWAAFAAEHPGYVLPLPPAPPTVWQRLTGRFRTAMIWPWARKTRS